MSHPRQTDQEDIVPFVETPFDSGDKFASLAQQLDALQAKCDSAMEAARRAQQELRSHVSRIRVLLLQASKGAR